MSKICPNCHTQLADNVMYCTKCGSKQELQRENITDNTNETGIINDNPSEKQVSNNTKQSEQKNPGSPMIMVLALIISFAIVGCSVYFISTYFQNDKSASTQEVAETTQQEEVTGAEPETVPIELYMETTYDEATQNYFDVIELSDMEFTESCPNIFYDADTYNITNEEDFLKITTLMSNVDSQFIGTDIAILKIFGYDGDIISHIYNSVTFLDSDISENLSYYLQAETNIISNRSKNDETLSKLLNYTPKISTDTNLSSYAESYGAKVYYLKWKCLNCYYVLQVISNETVTTSNWKNSNIISYCYYRDKEQIKQLKNEMNQKETYNESNYSENYNYSGSESFSLEEIAGYYIGCGSNTGLEIYADGYIDGSLQSSEIRSQWYSFSTSTCGCYLQQINSNTFIFNDQYGTELKLYVYYTENGLYIDAYVDEVFVTTMAYNGTV